jgi:hypothetical protein
MFLGHLPTDQRSRLTEATIMNKSDTEKISPGVDSLAEIFVDVTPRKRPGREAEMRAFAVLDAQWRHMTNQRMKRNRMMSWGIAASLLISIGIAYNWLGDMQPTTLVPVAEVARITGKSVYVNDSNISGTTENISAFQTGDRLRTGPESRLSLAWSSGGSLRVDQGTEIEFVSAEVVRLTAGSIYYDSLPYDRNEVEAPLFSVATAAGRLTHVGTQFMASADGEAITLGVREGQVRIDGPKFNFLAQSGDRLIIDADGLKEKQLVETYDDSWRWAEDIAPHFDPAGRTVQQMLTWISRETGRPFHYGSTSAESTAADTRLIGLDDLSPMQALRTVPFATDLQFEIVDGEIVISFDSDQR